MSGSAIQMRVNPAKDIPEQRQHSAGGGGIECDSHRIRQNGYGHGGSASDPDHVSFCAEIFCEGNHFRRDQGIMRPSSS